MNKNDLVAKVADKSGLSKKDSEKAINAFIETVAGSLKAGDKVSVVGFGTFEVRERAARKGRNPQTGAEVKIPASKGVRFSAGASFKTLLNTKGAVRKAAAGKATPAKASASKASASKSAAKTTAKTAASARSAKAPARAAATKAASTRAASKR